MRVFHTETVQAALRDGVAPPEVEVAGGAIEALLSLPVALGGTERSDTTNPERLFGAALAGCMVFAVEHTLRRLRRRPEALAGVRATAEVRIGRAPDRTNRLEVDLRVDLPALSQAEAEEVCLEATRYCPFHQALQGNVTETLTVVGAPPAS